MHAFTLDAGNDLNVLDREVMRRLLSLCRLHIAISDLKKKDLDLIKVELVQNKLASEEINESPYIKMFNRKHIPYWKKRHLKSLLHFSKQEDRIILRGLLNLKQPFSFADVQNVLSKTEK